MFSRNSRQLRFLSLLSRNHERAASFQCHPQSTNALPSPPIIPLTCRLRSAGQAERRDCTIKQGCEIQAPLVFTNAGACVSLTPSNPHNWDEAPRPELQGINAWQQSLFVLGLLCMPCVCFQQPLPCFESDNTSLGRRLCHSFLPITVILLGTSPKSFINSHSLAAAVGWSTSPFRAQSRPNIDHHLNSSTSPVLHSRPQAHHVLLSITLNQRLPFVAGRATNPPRSCPLLSFPRMSLKYKPATHLRGRALFRIGGWMVCTWRDHHHW